MSKFKVGDKIRRINPNLDITGKILEIQSHIYKVLFHDNSIGIPGIDYIDSNYELINDIIKEKPQYNFFESEMTATFDCDDTLVMWGIGGNQPYDMWAFTEQEKCKPEDVVRIECPYQAGEVYYLVKHNRHIKLLHDYKARGFGIVIWSAGGAKWAKAVTDALGLNGMVDLVMAKPNRHVDDMPCEKWMGERVYIDRNKH